MRALVTDREDLVVGADDRHLDAFDVDGSDPADGDVGERTGAVELGHPHRLSRGSRCADVLGELPLDRRHQPLLDLRDADLADDVGEEAVHDQATRFVGGHATRLQVEQLLVVEPARRRRVSGALDVTGLDLEVGDRVGSAAIGEHQVAVGLERLDALGDLADQHVAHPDRVGAVALQTTLVDGVALGVRLVVVDEQPVLDVLAGVGEVDAEQLGLAAGPGVLDVRVDAHQRRHRSDHRRGGSERRGRPRPRACRRAPRRRPSPGSTRGHVGAVTDDHLEVAGVHAAAAVVEHVR